jgi:hypothetical protein
LISISLHFSGHEIGHLGVDVTMDFLNNLGVSPSNVLLWIVLGSSIVTIQQDGSEFRSTCHFTEDLGGLASHILFGMDVRAGC